ncbi:Nucleotide-binding universal stress protein, UspA family [Salinihabitans flavidus]|uniref:Universal stress protein n=1 Tax=Salinihabitans flavidus TaxID=569882 RepID=A0A1H8U4F0_9RHOB|nr:universal stress protein [Salinihabitans flavidus]SEO98025.1 Nucleotide-binding universal stress protein, UspA family [Salinihabitans flavidus]
MSHKPVLCAIDVSNEDRDAKVLKKAAQLAQMEGAQLDVITVVPDYGMSVVGSFFEPGHHKKAEDEARRRLNALAVQVLGEEANKSVRHIVATGNAYEEILHVARADGAGLIVIGAHKPDFRDYLLGPNAARVVRHSECSVYVVR